MKKVLIANRGEIAVRIARTAAERGLKTVAVFSEEDMHSLHREACDEAVSLGRAGPAAYLDSARIVEIAQQYGCAYVHPGYGFLSENADFARLCAEAEIVFLGPDPEVLEVFGDKSAARALAIAQAVPVARGTDGAATLEEARGFMEGLGGPIMLKAVAGGGGRGMRAVLSLDELAEAYERCRSEALAAFGRGDVYAEQLIRDARHIEIQIIGDGTGAVRHLFERDCTLQRRHQKLIEIAPSPFLDDDLRQRIFADAVKLGAAVKYRGLGTVEFLVDGRSGDYIFIECNPRLQVEHTVTEEITGLDLVGAQFGLAEGARLDDLPLPDRGARPSGFAIQARVNMEKMQADARALPTGGTLALFETPTGPGVRVDTFGYTGYQTVGSFDSLLAKVIVFGRRDFAGLCAKTARALDEFQIVGVETNIPYLKALLADARLASGDVDTAFVERNAAEIHARAQQSAPSRSRVAVAAASSAAMPDNPEPTGPEGGLPIHAPMQGRIVKFVEDASESLPARAVLVILEAMKLEHTVTAEIGGRFVVNPMLEVGSQVRPDEVLGWLRPDESGAVVHQAADVADPDAIRPDLAEVLARREGLLDAARPQAVARRRKLNKNTARENVDLLFDPGSFVEYGGLTLAMQRGRRSEEELIRMSPADGVVTGVGSLNADVFGDDKARCAVMAYDYTVFAGTQGFMGHRKMDRIVHTAERLSMPFILFAEGGGGRPGDTDYVGVSALEFTTFAHLARLSGRVPLVGIVSGRCFAGNAALLGICDVIIATRDTSVGMAGPAMIEGGGLGVVDADKVGPVSVQSANGVIDIVVENETDAVAAAKTYLGFFQGNLPPGGSADQRLMRRLVPESRVAGYDIRKVIDTLCDEGTFVELRRNFGRSVVTGFARIEGRPIGLLANDGRHLGGALDSPSADKISRFLELCDGYGLPVVSLCDTPGFMVGPDSEKTAAVRHFSRIFVAASHIKVPVLAIILRKAYGLGAQAMLGGNLTAPVATVAWPTGELGPMGIEGAVRLAYRRELEAIDDPKERESYFQAQAADLYRQGRALNVATYNEIDDVIDPAQTRDWLVAMLRSLPAIEPGRQGSGVSPW